jgi:hypothetical protein
MSQQIGWRQNGSIITEYVAVLLGFVVFVASFPTVMRLIREHYAEFSWALSLPF